MESLGSYLVILLVLIVILRALAIGMYRHDIEGEQEKPIEENINDLVGRFFE